MCGFCVSFRDDPIRIVIVSGIRDEGALESALARPRQKWWYEPKTDIASLAAAYGFRIASNHPYRDGNKRAAFLALVAFLGFNGYEFEATDDDVVSEMFALAAGRVSENEFAQWIGGIACGGSDRFKRDGGCEIGNGFKGTVFESRGGLRPVPAGLSARGAGCAARGVRADGGVGDC